jgi:dTDP-4-dehydrorhamnose reductase
VEKIKILVTGSKGQLGSELRRLSGNYDKLAFSFTDLAELDICNADSLKKFTSELQPDYLINCAAYTAVDRAEDDEDGAINLNAGAVRNITSALEGSRCKLIHISTDYVLAGSGNRLLTEEDSPDPRSVYAKSKLAGERYALEYKNSQVIRTSWMYSAYGHNFVKTILRLAAERDEISVVNDQVGTPTWAADLAEAIISIIRAEGSETGAFFPGIYHYSNLGSCSWYEFAMKIKELKGLKLKINAVSTEEYKLPAYRPAYSVMSKDKIIERYKLKIPRWEDSLDLCLKLIDSE